MHSVLGLKFLAQPFGRTGQMDYKLPQSAYGTSSFQPPQPHHGYWELFKFDA